MFYGQFVLVSISGVELTDLEAQANGLNFLQSQANGLNVLQDNGINVRQDNGLSVLQDNGLNVLQSQAHGIGAHAKCGGSAGRERTNVHGEPQLSAVRDRGAAAAPSDSSPASSDVNDLQRTDGGRQGMDRAGEGSGHPPLNDGNDDHLHEHDLDQLAGHQDFIQGQEVQDAVRKNSDPSNQVNACSDCFA